MAPRRPKRLRGVPDGDVEEPVDITGNIDESGSGLQPISDEDISLPTGFKLSTAQVQAIDAKIESYRDRAKTAKAGLPDNVSITGHELDAATRSTVRFLLMSNSKQEGGLLNHKDVVGHIHDALAVQRKGVAGVVLSKARVVLASTFGLDLVELEKEGSKSSAKYFLLKSLVPSSVYAETVGMTDNRKVLEKRGILGLIVSLVIVSKGSLPEAELWRHLEALGLDRTRAKEIADDAVKKRYLKLEKSIALNDEVRTYALAERAAVEGMTEEAILAFVDDEFAEES
jgi:hypothetical protein